VTAFSDMAGLFWKDHPPILHGPDLFPQGADTPSLHPAHFSVEVSLKGVFNGDQGNDMRPTQLSYKRYGNSFFWEYLGKLDHATKIFNGKSMAIFSIRQRMMKAQI
jgi:hypothetical protein